MKALCQDRKSSEHHITSLLIHPVYLVWMIYVGMYFVTQLESLEELGYLPETLSPPLQVTSKSSTSTTTTNTDNQLQNKVTD